MKYIPFTSNCNVYIQFILLLLTLLKKTNWKWPLGINLLWTEFLWQSQRGKQRQREKRQAEEELWCNNGITNYTEWPFLAVRARPHAQLLYVNWGGLTNSFLRSQWAREWGPNFTNLFIGHIESQIFSQFIRPIPEQCMDDCYRCHFPLPWTTLSLPLFHL